MRQLIEKADISGIREALSKHPELANEGILLGDGNPALEHPLHRICDGVFNGIYSDEDAAAMASVFLEFGADVNGNRLGSKRDTPLIAAASLSAEGTGLLYIDHGADIFHSGCHGGTALHWASWCGHDRLVERLIAEGAEINRLCVDFASTPLFWSIHGMKFGGEINQHKQLACAELLLKAGADKNIPNIKGIHIAEMLEPMDEEARSLLNKF